MLLLSFILTLSLSAFAADRYGVYDAQGNLISSFEAEHANLLNKTRQIRNSNPNKNLYVSSTLKGKSSKPSSRYRYKAETGAYLEAKRKEVFSVCPEKEIEGTWISEHSVALNTVNCISIQAPNIAGTFKVLFLENNGKTDTIQVLVEQSYIPMGDYSHRIWVPDSMPPNCKDRRVCKMLPHGHYENRTYNQPLIVDKIKFTMGDAQYYSKTTDIDLSNLRWERVHPKNEKLEESTRPYIGGFDYKFANERSKKEGLDTVYYLIDNIIKDNNSYNTKNLLILGNTNNIDFPPRYFIGVDTSASGYRLPAEEEWFYLMRAGASTKYYWGDEERWINKEDSIKISKYAWINPVGLKQVAKLEPNRFGLYDMIGITFEDYMFIYDKRFDIDYLERNGSGSGYNTITYCSEKPECDFIRFSGTYVQYIGMPDYTEICNPECVKIEQKPTLKSQRANYRGFRLLRKTPKLHKLEKF